VSSIRFTTLSIVAVSDCCAGAQLNVTIRIAKDLRWRFTIAAIE
jgi:hypothetical protein